MLEPLSRLLFDRVDLRANETVLDIGCGCGSTKIRAARLVGPKGAALGLDISLRNTDSRNPRPVRAFRNGRDASRNVDRCRRPRNRLRCSRLPSTGGISRAVLNGATTGGISRAVLNGATPGQHRSALAAMHDAMRPFHDGTGVRLGASVWITSTRIP